MSKLLDEIWEANGCPPYSELPRLVAEHFAGKEPYRETRHHDCPFCGKQWREYRDDDNYPNYCPGCGEELREEA